MNPSLVQLAQRLATDPSFLAAALAHYALSEQLDDPALAAKLGCTVPGLTRLRLCRMPRMQTMHFWHDVETIATRFGVPAETLADMVRRGQCLIQWQASTPPAAHGERGFLLAARDDDRPTPEHPSPGETP
jgi:hypothetical protein